MFRLDKSNLREYLSDHYPAMDLSRPLVVSKVGEGPVEEDGDGFLNHIFRVSDGTHKLILKQSFKESLKGGFNDLAADRGRLEFDSLALRRTITPQYVPEPYFFDAENNILCVEDVSPLQIMRFQMNKGRIYPGFAEKLGEYLAKTHFYLSEYYLDLETFRNLSIHFMNHKMRNVFDDLYFITKTNERQVFGKMVDPLYRRDIMEYVADPRVISERFKLREQYVRHGEAFLHGDLHTSNILLNDKTMQVIDMEYTFAGPVAYDLGYFICNFISQYICAGFRPFPNEEERRRFKNYCLKETERIFETYQRIFLDCWAADAKPMYRDEFEYIKDDFTARLLSDTIGYSANSNMSRGPEKAETTYPEYAELPSEEARRHAMCLSVFFDFHSLLRRREYKKIGEWLEELAHIDDIYHKTLSNL
ncbi:MAG: phosphotransferase [Lachnospiraceae bacterium]|nr:phosphotransferase [Lachnospiraceae bacterium]